MTAAAIGNMLRLSSLLLLCLCICTLEEGFAAPATAPSRAPARGPTRATPPTTRAPARAPVRAPVRAPARAPVPSRLPVLPRSSCPYNYTVQSGDTYCAISSKVGISIARLQSANPRIGVTNVTPGTTFRIPCKPQTDCSPIYITAAAQGTGLGDILNSRPDLTLQQLLAANTNNANVTANFVSCGTEIRVPGRSGTPVCTGTGYPLPGPAPRRAPAPAPRRAPTPAPTRRAPVPAPTRRAPVPSPPRPAPSPTPRRVQAPTLGTVAAG